MIRKDRLVTAALLLALSPLCSEISTLAASTAFSVQGRLNANSAAANGTYDVRLAVFDSAGNPVSGTNVVSGVRMNNGVFTVTPDFGTGVFTGPDRWLEIGVSASGANSFTTIGRQPVLPTPYATHTQTAETVAPGAVVTSLNGLKDGVILEPGNNVTFVTNGNTLKINSSGGGGDSGHLVHDDGFVQLISDTDYYQAYIGVPTGQPLNFFVGAEDPANLQLLGRRAVFQGETDIVGGGLAVTGSSSPYRNSLNSAGVFMEHNGSAGLLFAYDYRNGRTEPLLLNSPGGSVGIGTTSPQQFAKLDVEGPNGTFAWLGYGPWPNTYAALFGGNVRTEGDSIVTGNSKTCTLTITGGCDLAEPFPMKEEQIERGSVVVIDEEHAGQLMRSSRAYDKRVAGIVSGANGINPGIALKQEGALDRGENVALTGRVYVQADASYGAIKPGDLLTTSDTPGHAMKVTDSQRAQGAVLGKAMTSLGNGRGMVLVLVSLQ